MTPASAPAQVRHYYRGARGPFLNLSDLDPAGLDRVIDHLTQERRAGVHRRVFGRRYMELRRRTEAILRQRFVEVGGRPERTAPHYFVLGASRWFEGLAVDMRSVVLDRVDLPEEATSFTYPDSFVAMGLSSEFGLPYEPKPYHGQVFRLAELDGIVARFGLPEDVLDGYDGYERRPFERFVEVQLWSDAPIRHLLA